MSMKRKKLKTRNGIQRLMEQKGLSQRDLAAAIGWASHSYLGKILRGTAQTVTQPVATRIARALGAEIGDLFEDTEREYWNSEPYDTPTTDQEQETK